MNFKTLLKVFLIMTIVAVSLSAVSAGLFGDDGDKLLEAETIK